ncbi:hypothetical protein GW916_01755 [bacterium]|nr:hypothetical protein [bacterium]
MSALKNLLFPSWGFFAHYDEFPVLMISGVAAGEALVADSDEWFQALQPSPWRWYHLFVSTQENLRLAKIDVLITFIDSLNSWQGDLSDIRALKSYQGVLSICSAELKKHNFRGKELRFKIVQPSASGELEDVFVSAVEELVWRF